MALKDWKKLPTSKEIHPGNITFYYKKDIAKLTIYKTSSHKWEVSITKFQMSNIINAGSDYFNTKPQALKFAKHYMKTH